MSFSFTGPLTFRMSCRCESSRNSTRTWVTPPREPVLPRTCCIHKINRHSTETIRRMKAAQTLITFASFTGALEVSWQDYQYPRFALKGRSYVPFFVGGEDDDRMSSDSCLPSRVIRFKSEFQFLRRQPAHDSFPS